MVEAHVDAYGYYLTTRSWVFVGWTSQAWTADQNAGITARFDGRDERGSVVSGFYDRPGLQGRGQGFVLAMPARPRRRQVAQSRLLGLQIGAADVSLTVDGHGYVPVEADELDRVLRPILADAPENENLAALLPHLPAGLVAEAPATRFDGYIDLYSYDLSLSGWFLLGWLRRPWREDIRPATVARFEGREAAGELRSAFYDRPDVRDRGFGCLLFLADTIAEGEQLPELLSLEVDTGSSRRRLQGPAREAATSSELLAEIGPLLGNAAPGSALAAFRSLLGLHAAPVVLPLSFEGYIDFCGYHAGAGGWLFCGWVTSPWADTDTPTAIAQFADGDVSGQALATFYRREEIADRGIGVVFLVPFRQRRAQTAALGRDRVPRVHGDASSERS